MGTYYSNGRRSRVVIYQGVRANPRKLEACRDMCREDGLEVAAVMQPDVDGTGWEQACRMLSASEAEVIVVYDRSEIPVLRIRAVTDEFTPAGEHLAARRRRPRRAG